MSYYMKFVYIRFHYLDLHEANAKAEIYVSE